jgi:hypothetical protein
MKFDWFCHEVLYRNLHGQNMKEAFAMREMSEDDKASADAMITGGWIPARVETLLDVGAKDGYAAWRFGQAGISCTAVDCEAEFVKKFLERGVKGISADMHFLPFEDNSFDMVYASHVLEHSIIPVLCLGEMARVSRRYVLLKVPQYPTFVKMVSHWAVVPVDVLERWLSAVLLAIRRHEVLKGREDCFLLAKVGHWPAMCADDQMKRMKAIRSYHVKLGVVAGGEGE